MQPDAYGKSLEYAFTDHNAVRPHSSIMYLAPKEFKNRWSSDPGSRAQYRESLEGERRDQRENRKKMVVEANGIKKGGKVFQFLWEQITTA